MGKKKKNVERCQVCGAVATSYVLGTDCATCDNLACHTRLEHEIKVAVEQYKEQEEWEKGRAV